MDFLRREAEIDAVVPGVTAAYRQLRDSGGQGLYTSLGRYYNNTIFGRDAGMTAKFVTFFDHTTAWETIMTLSSYQGQAENHRTHEQPGRIHHEMRDYSAWHGRWYDRLGLEVAGLAWGKRNRKLVSYYAADSTATYIRLIHKYSGAIDRSIIDREVPQMNGVMLPLSQSVVHAANWIVEQVDEGGIFWVKRANRWSLPYQTFADSVTAYAWMDGAPANTSLPHSYVEVQAYALDALKDAVRLLPAHKDADTWRMVAHKMQRALLDNFWNHHSQTFSPGLFRRNDTATPLDTDMIMSTWTLNTSFWTELPDNEYREALCAIVRRVFDGDFLTDFGIRTKSTATNEPLGSIIDYHGSQTIWPMFNFMFIEGLRRHGLYRLARQIEFRLTNTLNALGNFPEFFIVDHEGVLYQPDSHASLHKSGQMIPEVNIAFTVVPALTLAYRNIYRRTTPAKDGWKYELEESILATIPEHELLEPKSAHHIIRPTPLHIRRTLGGIRSGWHIAPVILKKPS